MELRLSHPLSLPAVGFPKPPGNWDKHLHQWHRLPQPWSHWGPGWPELHLALVGSTGATQGAAAEHSGFPGLGLAPKPQWAKEEDQASPEAPAVALGGRLEADRGLGETPHMGRIWGACTSSKITASPLPPFATGMGAQDPIR